LHIRDVTMISRKQLLEHAKSQGATDIHISAWAPILFRAGGKLVPVTKEILTPEQSRELTFASLTEKQKLQFKENLDYDLMLVLCHR
jgi:twitching motility protein PilU